MKKIDIIDRKILKIIQEDSSLSIDDIAKKIGSSKTPVWNRIQKLKKHGIIQKEVAILDASQLGFHNIFYVTIRTSEHDKEWLDKFLHTVQSLPEIQEAHRLAGDIDYILKVCVENSRAFDLFYQRLIQNVKIFSVNSSLSMETIKSTTSLALKDNG